MRETELKAVVPDESACLARLLAAGASEVFNGRLEDRRYDYVDRRLTMRDVVLRLRVRHTSGVAASHGTVGTQGHGSGVAASHGTVGSLGHGSAVAASHGTVGSLGHGSAVAASIDWKGAASFEAGYKHREEISTPVDDPGQMAGILNALGFVVTREIDRDIHVLKLGAATVRFERFPRMDTLIEIEGPEDAIETAIRASGLPRDSFSPDRLYMFVQRYEARTGQRAAICDAELRGEYRFQLQDA